MTRAFTLAISGACTLVIAAVAPPVSAGAEEARSYVVVYDTPPRRRPGAPLRQ